MAKSEKTRKISKKEFEKLLKSLIIKLYGKRCPDYEASCGCCSAWNVYDTIVDYHKGRL